MPSAKSINKEIMIKKPAAPKRSAKSALAASVKSTGLVQDSDDDNAASSDENSDSGGARASIKPKTNDKVASTSASGESGSDEESGSGREEGKEDSDESEESENTENSTPTESAHKVAKPSGTLTFAAPKPYKPPVGFESKSLDGTSEASQMLEKSRLDGKQIWYFTAPASVPISSIERMALQDTKNGKAVLTHKGNGYGFTQDSADKTYTKIMVPSSPDDGYRAVTRKIDQIFHLQQIVNANIENSARATVPMTKKPVRQQPKSLKMRFRPIGSASGAIGTTDSNEEGGNEYGADEEMTDARSAFVRPSLPESDEEMTGVPPPTKVKKDKSSKQSKDASFSSKRKHGEGGEKRSKHKKEKHTVK